MATTALAVAGPSGVPDEHDTEPKSTLTPPATSGESSKADEDDSSSELSDLDMEDEEGPQTEVPEVHEVPQKSVEDSHVEGDAPEKNLDPIEPAFYYEGGKIPVFQPTMEEFLSFDDFVRRIHDYGMKSGIVKVIPPKEWTDSLQDLDEAVKTIKVKNPITQEFHGTHGQYAQANMEKQRSYNLPQWKALCEESNHQPPAKRGERRRNQEATARLTSSKPKSNPLPMPEGQRRKPGRPRVRPLRNQKVDNDAEDLIEAPPTPISPKPKHAKSKLDPASDDERDQSKTENSVTARRKYNRREVNEEVDEEAFEGFDYRLNGLDEFSAERCKELETAYWKSLNFNNPMYGADMPGSLFDESTTSWNVAHLPNLLNVLGKEVPGVNTTYLYLGMWKATFSWHLEDMDLFSINYIHFGAPKQWYSISQEDARKFEMAMKRLWAPQAKACDQFLRHKTFLVSPQHLKSEFGITVNRLVHYQGEFVITFPYGYHSGYNLGYNCAESVNFATEEWLPLGRIAKKCNCEADSVFVDVAEIERKLRGEPTPEYEWVDEVEDYDDDEEQADMLTPPGSTDDKPAPKKRKRPTGANETPLKRIKIRVKVKPPVEQPCILCPNHYPFERLIPTDIGKKVHKRCAQYTNETLVIQENGVEKAILVDQIPRARWGLRCSYCHLKEGTCFQCSDKKCAVAFHPTCAAPGMVQVEEFNEPRYIPGDNQEYYLPGYDFRCPKHRIKRSKLVSEKMLKNDATLQGKAERAQPDEIVQYQLPGGKIFAGVVVENILAERTLILDTMPVGPRTEIEYQWLLFPDPDDSKAVKASRQALVLPFDKIRIKPSENDDPQPKQMFFGAEAINGILYVWDEFHVGKFDEDQPKEFLLDPKKPVQYWHYLGATSTEAKAQYTENPRKQRHNPKSNFLDGTERKAPPVPIPALHRSFPASYPTVQPNMNAVNASRAKYRQIEQQRSQMRPEKPYQYRPKDMPGVSIDPKSLVQQRAFLNQSNPTMPQYDAGYYHPQYSPGVYSPGQTPWYQPMSPGAQHAWGPQATFAGPGPSSAQGRDNGPYPPRSQVMSGSGQYQPPPPMSSMRDPYGYYQSQQSNTVQQPQPQPQVHGHRMLLPATAQHGGPQPTPYPQKPVSGTAPAFALQVRPTFASFQGPPPSTNVDANAREVNDATARSLKKYPYLYQSYIRAPRVYVSPYKAGEGFNDGWLPNPPQSESKATVPQSSAEPYLLQRTPSQQELIKQNSPVVPPSLRYPEPQPNVPTPHAREILQQSLFTPSEAHQLNLYAPSSSGSSGSEKHYQPIQPQLPLKQEHPQNGGPMRPLQVNAHHTSHSFGGLSDGDLGIPGMSENGLGDLSNIMDSAHYRQSPSPFPSDPNVPIEHTAEELDFNMSMSGPGSMVDGPSDVPNAWQGCETN